ncbi:hypothetical protein PsYK624_033440 [Phanerochaete sordida]|uniref:DUF6535 domain-containing protein n=1 Tax=Phanerochaete sordida TaxID=48140 RepID=A0A9P3G2V7_9APHY|nr:hypothetical protein PsYK624_033440 [Phanerochaete sordida]
MLRKTVRVKAEQAPAEGWPYVEDYMKTYDDGVMEDYAEDVDTLLVLDGLFSAVVTAFAAISYTLLQPDNTQATVQLLLHISTQLSSLTVVPPYINSTVLPSNAGIGSFQPTTAARWINSLWFLSLVLSLTSALLGILAKQWIREYLKWNSATGAPRDNILVRQIRAEAWDDWHVPALIASIPALLELAIVLFVCGLTAFLWTLDLVVAIVMTISVVLFTVLVVVLTVLPTVFKRCPYRSPTAWAILVFWKFIRRRLLGRLLRRFYVEDEDGQDGVKQGWRSQDLKSVRLETLVDSDGDIVPASAVVLEELELEMKDIVQPFWDSEPGTYTIQVSPSAEESLFEIPVSIIGQHLYAMTEPSLLFRALSWLSAASQDARLLQQLRQCSESIHSPSVAYAVEPCPGMERTKNFGDVPHRRLVDLVVARSFRHLGLFYMLARACMPRDADISAVASAQLKLYNAVCDVCDETKKISASSISACVLKRFRMLYTVSSEHAIRYRRVSAAPLRGLGNALSNPQRRILSALLVLEMKSAVAEMLSSEVIGEAYASHFLVLFSRRIAELLCGLREVVLKGYFELPMTETFGLDCLVELCALYNTIVLHPEKRNFDTAFPGLRTFIVDFMSDYVILNFATDGTVQVSRLPSSAAQPAGGNGDYVHGHLDTSTWAALADMYPIDDPDATREDYNIFAMLLSSGFRALRGEWVHQRHSPAIGALCRQAVRLLERAAERSWRNAGSYHSLDWLVSPEELSFRNRSSPACCELLYRHVPDDFMDLLCTVQKNCDLLDHAASDLRYMLEWTALVQHFSFAESEHTQAWHQLFVRAANEWIRSIGQYSTRSPLTIDRDVQRWLATLLPQALEATAGSLDIAVEAGWDNGGYYTAEFPWLESMFLNPSFSDVTVDPPIHGTPTKLYAPNVYFGYFAPTALRQLTVSLIRTILHGRFTSVRVREDVQLLRFYLKASPTERKGAVHQRQAADVCGDEAASDLTAVTMGQSRQRLRVRPSHATIGNLSCLRALPYSDTSPTSYTSIANRIMLGDGGPGS